MWIAQLWAKSIGPFFVNGPSLIDLIGHSSSNCSLCAKVSNFIKKMSKLDTKQLPRIKLWPFLLEILTNLLFLVLPPIKWRARSEWRFIRKRNYAPAVSRDLNYKCAGAICGRHFFSVLAARPNHATITSAHSSCLWSHSTRVRDLHIVYAQWVVAVFYMLMYTPPRLETRNRLQQRKRGAENV
jgi:hypothetical protein